MLNKSVFAAVKEEQQLDGDDEEGNKEKWCVNKSWSN